MVPHENTIDRTDQSLSFLECADEPRLVLHSMSVVLCEQFIAEHVLQFPMRTLPRFPMRTPC